ncbi:MAG: hypothetical protein ACRC2T_19595 [Thermoguttaceae bacterium]
MALTITSAATAGNSTKITYGGATGSVTLYRALGSETITSVNDAIEDGTLFEIYTSEETAGSFCDEGLLPETAYKYYIVDEQGNQFTTVTTLTVIDLVPNNEPAIFTVASNETLQFEQVERFVPLSGNKAATILVVETDEPVTQDTLEEWFADDTVAAEIVATEQVGSLNGMTPQLRLLFSLLYARKG